MKIHDLKILPRWFEDVYNLKKNFEIRRNDREFQVGDLLHLMEYENGKYTGRTVFRKVEYIYLGDGTCGLSDEFCVLGLNGASVTEIIESVKDGICDEFCKHSGQIKDSEQRMSICGRCPLNRL